MILRISGRSRPLGQYVCYNCAKLLKHLSRKYATEAFPEIYDVAVVGSGPAGLSLLTALRTSASTSHLKLALIESQDIAPARKWTLPPNQYSNRASSLTPASVAFLSRIGAWDHVDQSRIQRYDHMRVWDGLSSTGRISFDSATPIDQGIAYMTENPNLVRALHTRLAELSAFDIFDKTSVSGIHLGPPAGASASSSLDLSTYPHVTLSSNKTLTTRLLIGADGFNSPVRTFGRIPTRGWDYDRHGVVATLKVAPSTSTNTTTAFQRFLPTGPIALLALPNNHATLVWTTTPTHAAHLKSLPPADFLAMVNSAFRLSVVDLDYLSTLPSGQSDEFSWRDSVHAATLTQAESINEIPALATALQENSLASFPLRLRHASTYIRPRLALLGDAAHTIHPLAGQGLNMGLSDSRALSSAIADAVEHGADIGDEMQCLDSYNREVWWGNQRMLGVVDKLHWLYSARSAPVVGARGVGLGVVDWVGERSGLKGWVMRMAGGR